MSKYSCEEKLEAVLRVVDDGMSSKVSAKILGTAEAVVRRRVARYQQFGLEGLILKHGSYDGDFKVYVIEYMHKNHMSLFQAAVTFGIPNDATVGKWERIYYEEGHQALYRDNRGRSSKINPANQRRKSLTKKLKKI